MQKLETKFWNHAMVEAGHAAYTDRFHELARLVPHFITPENKRIESEAIRNGSHKKNTEKKGNGGEPSIDRNVKDDNKRSKTGNAFATTVNPVRREYTGTTPKCTNCNLHHSPKSPCPACFSCNRLGHLAKDCRVVPRMVNLVNARNPTTTRGACFECGGTDHFKIYARSRKAAIRMSWEDFKNLTREEFCLVNEMQKLETEFWNHAMVGADHATYTDRFHELARLVPHLVTPENKRIEMYIYGLAPQIHGMVATTKPETIQKVMLKVGTLIDEAIRNGSLKKNTEKRCKSGEPSRDRNVRDDNKRSRTGNAFATTANPVCNAVGSAKDCRVVPRMVNPFPTAACGACFECGGTNHFKAACPRLNQAQRPGGGRPNQVVAIDGGQGRGNNGNRARRGAFIIGAEVARQDPNIMTGTFTLNNHYATTLFDSIADYSFVSTAFTPLLGIESSNLGFSYEIEIASGQLVEIDKVIRGCELEIEGHTFNIDLIPFGSESFDVIVGMDWLSKHKAKIICHEKVVRIPLRNGKTLRVIGERPEEKVGHLKNKGTKEGGYCRG
ncbi:putative reverse transcriptase domain-containing protein [Tanacetum coccineum]